MVEMLRREEKACAERWEWVGEKGGTACDA